ncbi:MAG: sulfatase-like hydrolase/transferase [Verrucomicrobiota bacterium]
MAIILAAAVATLLSTPGVNAASRPNVVLILIDDIGYEAFGAYGGTSYKTPVINKLAADGIRFDKCFVQPLCTPTRVQLMTGIYNVRNYISFGNMDRQATTFGNLFHQAGYATCMAGKWQLGHDLDLPKKFGFDEYCLWQHMRRPERYKNPGLEINGVTKNWTNGEYGPDIVSDYALDFIKRKKDAPFFLYYPMMLTHAPYVPTPDSPDYNDKAKVRPKSANARPKGPNGENPYFTDMVAYMDKLVGKLLARLDELGLRENTLVLFLGDNGTGRGLISMIGDRRVIGGKGQTTDTGMHVPLIASWPAKMRGGKAYPDLVDATDILPTICEAAGIQVPPSLNSDGRSFLPQLRGEKGNPREWVYSWYSRGGVLAQARECAFNSRFKLYRTGEFFDLTNDLEEKKPLTVASLEGDAAKAAKLLQAALDKYANARPAELKKLRGAEGKKADEE